MIRWTLFAVVIVLIPPMTDALVQYQFRQSIETSYPQSDVDEMNGLVERAVEKSKRKNGMSTQEKREALIALGWGEE